MIDYKILLNNKTILVTGGVGFIGSSICEQFIKYGAKVKCMDNYITGHKSNIESLMQNNRFNLIEGNIEDYQCCVDATDGVDYVFHEAARVSVPESMEMPTAYYKTNIDGMINMLEASCKSGVKKFIYASSSAVYGDESSDIKKEHIIGNPLSPYAISKRVDEVTASQYSELYGLQTIGLRYFNVFGPKQDPNGAYAAVIPKFICQIIKGLPCEIYGDGLQTRDFTYIDNVVQANILALNSQRKCGVYNVACGERLTIIDIYNKIAEIMNTNMKPVYRPERDGDIRDSGASISKICSELGYEPMLLNDECLLETINWYYNVIGDVAKE